MQNIIILCETNQILFRISILFARSLISSLFYIQVRSESDGERVGVRWGRTIYTLEGVGQPTFTEDGS